MVWNQLWLEERQRSCICALQRVKLSRGVLRTVIHSTLQHTWGTHWREFSCLEPPAPHLSLWGWFTAAVYHYTSGEIHSENIWRRSKLPRLQSKARFWIRIDKRNIFCMKMFCFLFERWGHRNLGCKIQRRVFRLQEKKSWWRCRTVKLLLLLPPSFCTSSTSEVLWFLQLWMCHVGFQEEETCSVFVSSMESVLSLWTQI